RDRLLGGTAAHEKQSLRIATVYVAADGRAAPATQRRSRPAPLDGSRRLSHVDQQSWQEGGGEGGLQTARGVPCRRAGRRQPWRFFQIRSTRLRVCSRRWIRTARAAGATRARAAAAPIRR